MSTDWRGPVFVDAARRHHRVLSTGTEARRTFVERVGEVGSPGARRMSLPAGFAFPGFVDAHGHLGRLGQHPDALRFDTSERVDAIVRRVAERALSAAPGEWVLGSGWLASSSSQACATQVPPRQPLSLAAPSHPVCLTRGDGHAIWVNAAALALSGVDRSSPDPPGGRIERDTDGRPSGILVDTAMALVERHIPPTSPADRARVVQEEAALFVRTGVTCVHEMAVDAALWETLSDLDRAGALPLRVRAFLIAADPGNAGRLAREADPPGPERLRCRGVKLFADGALGSHGARLTHPYPDGSMGVRPDSEAIMRAALQRARQGGWQVAVHAIGDAAVADALTLLIEAAPDQGARWRIEHAQVVTPGDRERMARAGLFASVQPIHAVHDLPWASALLGDALLPFAYPWRALLDAGIPIGLGADHPIEHVNVPHTLFAAMTRRDPDRVHTPLQPGEEQRITLEEALHAGWRGGAALTFDEPWLGALAPGFMADFAVWDTDLSSASPDALRQAQCVATVVNGTLVWER